MGQAWPGTTGENKAGQEYGKMAHGHESSMFYSLMSFAQQF
jgi:hypothetical protein